MLTAQLFLPLEDNEGEPMPDELLEALVAKAVDDFGGATLRNPSTGYWEHRGRVITDEIQILEIDIPSTLEAKNKVVELARIVKVEMNQKAVHLRFIACLTETV